MPYETRWTERGVEWRYYGDVSAAETRRADREFYGDARADYADYQVVDLRDATSLDLPPEEQRLTAAFDGAASLTTPGVRVAFIVPDGRFDGALKVYLEHINRTSWSARIFTDPADARAWCERRGEDKTAERRRRLALDR